VNKYEMTAEDLKYELGNIAYDETRLLKREDGRREYIDRLLEKEILLQEAQRQGLDREGDFMKSIENYWEQALLKLLLQRKSSELSGLVNVDEDEIKKYYKDSRDPQPFSKVKGDIRRIIKQKKDTEAMNAWIEDLRKKSHIKINDELLNEVFSNRIKEGL